MNDYIILLIVKTTVWCQLFQHRFYKTYFNVVLLAQFIVFHFNNSYSIVVVDGWTIMCCHSNLHNNNSYKIEAVITDIIIYYYDYLNLNIKNLKYQNRESECQYKIEFVTVCCKFSMIILKSKKVLNNGIFYFRYTNTYFVSE